MRNQIFGKIDQPCTYGWENMEGTETVRYCKQCKLNVHNLSNMNEDEARKVLDSSSGRSCVRMQVRPDGSVYTDNCPNRLRHVRNMLRRFAPFVLVVLAWAFNQSAADAQGLVGAPHDGTIRGMMMRAQSEREEMAAAAAASYHLARGLSFVATTTSFTLGITWGLWRLVRTRSIALKLMLTHNTSFADVRVFIRKRWWQAMSAITALPLFVHLLGSTWLDGIRTRIGQ